MTLAPSNAELLVIEAAVGVVTVGATGFMDTVPFKVKSSKRNVPPVPPEPVNEITTVIVPVKFCMVDETVVDPIDAPVVGTEPDPTEVPLIVIDQF